jgi:hypothetical protein
MSGGTVFLIILIVAVSVYLGVGILYNVFVAKKSGYSVIPNYRMWSYVAIIVLVSKTFLNKIK